MRASSHVEARSSDASRADICWFRIEMVSSFMMNEWMNGLIDCRVI